MRRYIALIVGLTLIVAGVVLQLNVPEPVSAASVQVQVEAKEKIVLTMADVTINFGQLDPGSTVTHSVPVTANVRCNKRWNLTYEASGMDNSKGMPLSSLKWGRQSDGSDAQAFVSSGSFLTNQPKSPSNDGYDFVHYYTISVPWTADPGSYSATITYTATYYTP